MIADARAQASEEVACRRTGPSRRKLLPPNEMARAQTTSPTLYCGVFRLLKIALALTGLGAGLLEALYQVSPIPHVDAARLGRLGEHDSGHVYSGGFVITLKIPPLGDIAINVQKLESVVGHVAPAVSLCSIAIGGQLIQSAAAFHSVGRGQRADGTGSLANAVH